MPATDNRENDIEMRSEIQQQGIVLSVTMPYRDTEFCKSLVCEIIKPNVLKKIRQLKYYDNVAFTETDPFVDNVTMHTGKLNYEVGKIVGITADFVLAVPSP